MPAAGWTSRAQAAGAGAVPVAAQQVLLTPVSRRARVRLHVRARGVYDVTVGITRARATERLVALHVGAWSGWVRIPADRRGTVVRLKVAIGARDLDVRAHAVGGPLALRVRLRRIARHTPRGGLPAPGQVQVLAFAVGAASPGPSAGVPFSVPSPGGGATGIAGSPAGAGPQPHEPIAATTGSTAGGPTGPPSGTGSSGGPPAGSGAGSSGNSAAESSVGSGSAGSAPGSADPSGVPMPVGNIPGWNEVAADDFTGSSLNAGLWQAYNGFAPGGDPGGWWSASHVSVANGELQLSTYRDPSACNGNQGCRSIDDYVSGGVKMLHSQVYGKYLVRMRADNAEGVTLVALLWPTNNSGNGEIDFAEDNGASPRSQITTTLWDMDAVPTRDYLNVNLSQWHTIGVEWSPGMVVYTLDGAAWATEHESLTPNVPLSMDIQQQTWNCGATNWEQCPNSTTPAVADLDVDWAVEYAPA